MRGKDARRRLAEGERESVEELMRAVPDVLVATRAERRSKLFRVMLAHETPDAVRADEQITPFGEHVEVFDLFVESKINPQLRAALLQNIQEAQARDA